MSKTYYFYKIYKDEFCYIGSTTDLKNRQKSHKNDCTNENMKGYNRKIYKTIRDNGGWECFNFELIKQFDNLTRQEAHVIERLYIEEFGNLNMVNSIRTKEDIKIYKNQYYLNNLDKCKERNNQYYLNNLDKCKERNNQYYLNNQDKIAERSNQYRLNNKEKKAERDKQYRLNNKEKKAEQNKQYALNNKEKIKERYAKWNVAITCDCGSETTKGHLSSHRKTKKHQDYLLITVS